MPGSLPYVAGWVGMVGIVLTLHFGLFHLLSCAWRSAGVEARPLMNDPLASQSVSEFWGRRWNTAFRDLAHRFLFRPLSARLGPRWGLFASVRKAWYHTEASGLLPTDATFTNFAQVNATAELDPVTVQVGLLTRFGSPDSETGPAIGRQTLISMKRRSSRARASSAGRRSRTRCGADLSV